MHKLGSLPEYVGTATPEDCISVEGLNENQVIKIGHEIFPVHNPAAVWTSAARFMESSKLLDSSEATEGFKRLLKEASFFGIDSDVHLACDTLLRQEKEQVSEMTDNDYAYVNGSVRQLPILDSADILKCASWLKEHRGDEGMTLEVASDIADRVLRKADTLKTAMDTETLDWLERVACRGRATNKTALDSLQVRIGAAVGDENLKKAFDTLVNELASAKFGDLAAEDARKLAIFCDQVDRSRGIKCGADTYPHPEDSIYDCGTTKLLTGAWDHIKTPTGCVYQKSDLGQLDKRDIEAHLGTKIAHEICPLIEPQLDLMTKKIASMTLEEAEAFDRMANDRGIMPIVRTKSRRVGFTTAELIDIAG